MGAVMIALRLWLSIFLAGMAAVCALYVVIWVLVSREGRGTRAKRKSRGRR